MKVVHDEIISALSVVAGTANRTQSTTAYTGSPHQFYAVPVATRRRIIIDTLHTHREVSDQEWLMLVDRLCAGQSHEEKTMGAYLLAYRPSTRLLVTPTRLRQWFTKLHGWAEVDALAYNIFPATELLNQWPKWESCLKELSHHKNPNLRRAALVLLCGPVRKSADARLYDLALELVTERLIESQDYISKACSWLLRCMIDTERAGVIRFMASHSHRMPRLVVREVTRKLTTGKKNR